MPARKSPSTQVATHTQRQKLVDEFARIDSEVQAVKPLILRHEKLRRLILGWYPNAPAEDEIIVPGISYDILISSPDNVRSVTIEGKRKLFKLWGSREFIAKSVVLLKSLPDPKDEESLYTVQALTGPRHLHVTKRAQSAAQPAA